MNNHNFPGIILQSTFFRTLLPLTLCAAAEEHVRRVAALQAVDLRWGVRSEDVDDHHLDHDFYREQLRECQATSAGPSFLVRTEVSLCILMSDGDNNTTLSNHYTQKRAKTGPAPP